MALVATAAIAVAACSSSGGQRRAEPADVGRQRRRGADGAGLAGLRRERLDRPDRRTGSSRSRTRPAARSRSRRSARPTRRSACSRRTPTKFDVVSASGDASLRLVRAGYVQPVNVDLVPNYADIFPDLKDKPYNTVDGVHYGIPHGRGANLLMWRTDKVSPDPTSWSDMFDPTKPWAGKVSVYDAPIYIADAAVVLMKTQPDLGIKNPYALDDKQFAAVVDLLKAQKPAIGQYWTDYTKQQQAFETGDAVIGTTWQVINNLLQGETPPIPVKAIQPPEGATGWSDTWMINSKTTHLNCAYKWLDYIVSPSVNDQVAEWFGEAPANSKACAVSDAAKANCDTFYAADTGYWTTVWYWQTPETKCVDGRTDVTCKGFDDWVKAWTEIKG